MEVEEEHEILVKRRSKVFAFYCAFKGKNGPLYRPKNSLTIWHMDGHLVT